MRFATIVNSPSYAKDDLGLAVAVLCAAVVPAIAFAALSPITGKVSALSLLIFSLLFYPISFGAVVLFAVPALLLAKRFGLINLWFALVAGTLSGAGVLVLILLLFPSTDWRSGLEESLAGFAGLGASTGLVFFLVLGGVHRVLKGGGVR